MGKEKRNYPRSQIQLAVSYDNMDDFLTDYTSNISIGGFFLVTDADLQKGHQFNLKLELPDGSKIKAVGTVQWISVGESGSKGVGVTFSVIAERDRRIIRRLLENWDS